MVLVFFSTKSASFCVPPSFSVNRLLRRDQYSHTLSERRYDMKSKIVIEVQMRCEKCRPKAMQIAAAANGVESVSLEGDEKNRVVVTGDGVDSVKLATALRKKFGRAYIIEQGEVKKKEEEKKPEKVEESKIHWWHGQPMFIYDWPSNPTPGVCSIL